MYRGNKANFNYQQDELISRKLKSLKITPKKQSAGRRYRFYPNLEIKGWKHNFVDNSSKIYYNGNLKFWNQEALKMKVKKSSIGSTTFLKAYNFSCTNLERNFPPKSTTFYVLTSCLYSFIIKAYTILLLGQKYMKGVEAQKRGSFLFLEEQSYWNINPKILPQNRKRRQLPGNVQENTGSAHFFPINFDYTSNAPGSRGYLLTGGDILIAGERVKMNHEHKANKKTQWLGYRHRSGRDDIPMLRGESDGTKSNLYSYIICGHPGC